MTLLALSQVFMFLFLVLALVKPLGSYMANVHEGESTFLGRVLGPVERLCYRMAGVDGKASMNWKQYAFAFLLFNALGVISVYAIQRFQDILPLNPQRLAAVEPSTAFNTAVSFATNTNWQAYGGETTLSYFTQMLGLTVQNFVSAASGMAVLVALARGLSRAGTDKIGNFWVDLVRSTLYILVPVSFVVAIVLVSQGVVQTLSPYAQVAALQSVKGADGHSIAHQVLALGPAASQVAIKQIGTNGGGFFNANSAHPFENPTALSNLVQMLSILGIAAALCHTFGKLVKDTRQGWVLLGAMLAIFIPLLLCAVWAEQAGNPLLHSLGIDQHASTLHPGGNMEGKELRFGIANSAIWATATTAASNGSVNAMHDSFTPLGGMIPMCLMQLGEVVFGGVGSGLYGMIVFAIVTVFVAGLMVGRTPEYLGKKIEVFEVKMASLVILVPPTLVLIGTAIAVSIPSAHASVLNPGPHGFSEILYAFSSAGNNNGSAFGGLTVSTPFYNVATGVAMFLGRYLLVIPVLAIAGSLAKKKTVPPGLGTLPTHSFLFGVMLVGVVVIVGALTFIPALALGPIAEHLSIATH